MMQQHARPFRRLHRQEDEHLRRILVMPQQPMLYLPVLQHVMLCNCPVIVLNDSILY